GNPAPTYQWYFNDQPIARATTPSLNRTGIQADQLGRYKIVVRNAVGQAAAEVILTAGVSFRFDAGDYLLANGQLELQIQPNLNNRPIILEDSTNLLDWTPIATNVTGSKLKFLQPINQGRLFFRSVQK
ncbi:MAG: Immunoglobulin I-set domain protein, partial [Verrucomicrobiales bacterium]|nr:Immunoglobulin I-set domain protein [Verrucomicrobiales bacterium]